MISEALKKARKAKKLSQEEMAVKLNVVRQTVSKWENGLSVPDADVLIQIANLLEVSVSQLLGVEVKNEPETGLADMLAELNAELAEQKAKRKLVEQVDKKRGFILFLAIAALLISATVGNEVLSIIMIGICLFSALIILYRNMALLTSVSTSTLKIGSLQITTLFNIGILILILTLTILDKMAEIQILRVEDNMFEVGIISIIILFGGMISSRLPFNKHTGLRLPWTVRDEETWNVAHKVISIISLPFVLLYLAASCTLTNYDSVSAVAIILWIGIPGIISGIFFLKKFRT